MGKRHLFTVADLPNELRGFVDAWMIVDCKELSLSNLNYLKTSTKQSSDMVGIYYNKNSNSFV